MLKLPTLAAIIMMMLFNWLCASSDIADFSIELENSTLQDEDVTVLFQGPNGTPHDIAIVKPGPWSIDLSDLPPDNYSLILSAEGYAEQWVRIAYKAGKFLVTGNFPDNKITLYRIRYVTMEMVWNPKRQQDLSDETSLREVFTTSYLGHHRVIGPDWSFIQTISGQESKRADMETGPNIVLRKHRHAGFFGVSYPEANENFEEAKKAPANDQYLRDGMIFLKKGDWFYLRISGHVPETIAYAKLRVIDISLDPPEGANLLNERSPKWKRAMDTAKRLKIELPQ